MQANNDHKNYEHTFFGETQRVNEGKNKKKNIISTKSNNNEFFYEATCS